MRNWYEIKAKKDSADIYIYDEIGFFGISASRFVSDLRQVKGKPLNVYINSPGGDVFDSVAIYNALARHDAPVSVIVDGLAASGAAVIAQAGSKRAMATGSSMMIHDAWGIAIGPASEMDKASSELDKISDSVADIFAERAGRTPKEWREQMREETWYNAEDAVNANLADEVRSGVQGAYAGRVFNLSKFNKAPDWVLQDKTSASEGAQTTMTTTDSTTANDRVDLSTQPGPVPDSEKESEMTDLKEVRGALGLGEDGDILAAITALQTRALDIATGEKGEANQLRRELDETRKSYLQEANDLRQRVLEVEAKMRDERAEHEVDLAIQQGRVEPKDRDVALGLAKTNPDAFKKFSANLRVDLVERGSATDAQMADLEPTADELRVAQSMGVDPDKIRAQKAADKGIKLPS